jgi:hypothetical protein
VELQKRREDGEMESSCASALPVREPENIEAAREWETNASDPFTAPEVAQRRETNPPCPKGTAKSTGAQETNMPKERSAAVRRDGEPLTNSAKKRQQKEAAADRHQAAAGERPPSSVREGTRTVPLLATAPGRKLRDTVDADQPQLTAAKAGRVETSRGDSRLNCDPATRLRLEARSTLARYLIAGTDCLSPLAVRRIIQVADEDVMDSLKAVCRLDREVHELSTTHPGGDPIEQMESVVQMYEEEILEWERTVHPDSDVDLDLMQEPTGQKLVEVLEKIRWKTRPPSIHH